jgi:hypothetical protein
MVLFLNSQSAGVVEDIPMLCKMMYNVECNRKIFRLNGNPQSTKVHNDPFNSYTYKQVNYNISPSYGVLVIYGDCMPIKQFAELLQTKFEYFKLYDRIGLSPYSLGTNKSTAYTLISKDSAGLKKTSTNIYHEHYRKIITNLADLNLIMKTSPKFIWYVLNVSNKAYLYPPELSTGYPSEEYLNNALSTIIYDGAQLLNVKHGMMQINYPALTQYTISYKSRIIPELVYISVKAGLLLEIASYYDDEEEKDEERKYLFYDRLPTEFQNYYIGCIEYASAKVRRLDPSKLWHVQLNTHWDYQDQEDQEKNIIETGKPTFHNDVCFLSKTPLYNTVYLIEVIHNKKKLPVVFTTEVKTTEIDPIVSCIFVSPYMMHYSFEKKQNGLHMRLPEYLKTFGYQIIGCSTVKFPRKEFAVIKEIKSNKISDKKRELLYIISKYGCMRKIKNNQYYMYAFNPNNNQVYCGFPSQINDIEILEYQNTNTILFRYIDV